MKGNTMFKSIIRFFKEIFDLKSLNSALESYIVAGNPQTPGEVEQLEKEFYARYERHFFGKYY